MCCFVELVRFYVFGFYVYAPLSQNNTKNCICMCGWGSASGAFEFGVFSLDQCHYRILHGHSIEYIPELLLPQLLWIFTFFIDGVVRERSLYTINSWPWRLFSLRLYRLSFVCARPTNVFNSRNINIFWLSLFLENETKMIFDWLFGICNVCS